MGIRQERRASEISPFLGRAYTPFVRESDRFNWERAKGRMTLERLLNKKWARIGFAHHMQRLGDWGREHFPFIGAHGWNGLGGRWRDD